MAADAMRRFFGFKRSKGVRNYDCVVLLWGPGYDRLTFHTSEWIDRLAAELQLSDHALVGDSVSRENVIRSLAQTKGMRRVKIFFGHGVEDALLGPPQKTAAGAVSRFAGHSSLYDQALIEPLDQGESSLYAFCCRAGVILGQEFGSSSRRAFLGYQIDLPLEIGNPGCLAAWQRVTSTITIEIIEAGRIYPEHRSRLEDLYREEIDRFVAGADKSNDKRLIMMMYLRRHMKEICYYSLPL